MMTIQEIRRALRDRNLSYVARQIGMHRQQLWQIANGVTPNPRADTLELISNYLEGRTDDPTA